MYIHNVNDIFCAMKREAAMCFNAAGSLMFPKGGRAGVRGWYLRVFVYMCM